MLYFQVKEQVLDCGLHFDIIYSVIRHGLESSRPWPQDVMTNDSLETATVV